MRVYLVRHGDVDDPANYDTPLLPSGIEQSHVLASRIGSFRGDIYSSAFRRCAETADIIARDCGGLEVGLRLKLGEVGSYEYSLEEAQRRAIKEFSSLSQKSRDMIIVSHGGIIQAIAKHIGHPDGVCNRGEMIVIDL